MEDKETKQEQQRLANEKANRRITKRILILLLVFGIAIFILVFFRLFRLMVIEHDKYEKMAINNQTRDVSISANRGVIYDRNMNILATSTSAESVFLDPWEIAENGTDLDLVATKLSEILGVEKDFVKEQASDTKSRYKTISRKVPLEKTQEIRDFIKENGIYGIHLEDDPLRYYPYTSLAAQMIGFVNKDNEGNEGLESFYDDVLTGNAGRVITTKANNETQMLYTYEKYYDAADGNNLVLTLDTTVQYYLEKNIETAIAKYDILNGGFGIVMDVNTGEILGMATVGSYDPNDYLEIYDSNLAQNLEEMYLRAAANPKSSEAYKEGMEEYNASMAAARLRQWRNRSVSDGYEPGSTFKLVTLAAALNEKAVSLDDSFYCGGSADFVGREQTLHCWKHEGHGMQSTEQSLGNSCNIAFANIGLKLGGNAFYDYAKAFGLMEQTGIDLPGEASGFFFPRENLTGKSTASLISGSFGQTFKVTPLQMVRAIAAIVNGGYLLEPYTVAEVQDANGNVIQRNEKTVLRQVISEETSQTMRELMEFVVTDGTAGSAKTVGYRVGGKTGTSEKIDEFDEYGNPVEDKMVSFIGVAPINDPKYVVLVVLDTPSRATGLYISGGVMAAPTVRNIFTDILPYLGVEPNYSDEDIGAVNVSTPAVVGMTEENAKKELEEKSLSYRKIGSGDTVTGQIPAAGGEVPGKSEIILYMGEDVPADKVTVPDFVGMSPAAAKSSAAMYGLYVQGRGTEKLSSSVCVTYQTIKAGAEVPRGTTITVEFTNNTVQD